MKDQLSNRFNEHLLSLLAPYAVSKPRLIVALSGGLDSVVLLHLLYQFTQNIITYDLLAHNVNHGLSENSDSWEEFCAHYCGTLAIPLIRSRVDIKNKTRTSLEALARDARYQAFKDQMIAEDIIFTGHHQDDQLETLLLALKRGSGSTGLQGIKTIQGFSEGHLLRPLLIFSRQELADYAKYYQLEWIEDESNLNIDFDRNFIRQKISPLLQQRWPQLIKTASRTAQLCQEQQSLLDELAGEDLKKCLSLRFASQTLDIETLSCFSHVRRNNVIRFWLKSRGLQYPSSKQLDVLWTEVALAQTDKQPILKLDKSSIRRYQGYLYIVLDRELALPDHPLQWTGEETLWISDDKYGINFSQVSKLYAQQYHIECYLRQHLESGVTCLPEGRMKARSVKKLLHEYQVPPWLRDQVVFLFVDHQLNQAIGLWQCQGNQMPAIDVSLKHN